MPQEPAIGWTIIVPLKALPGAKSRLLPASDDPVAHSRLVDAIRADTLASAAQAGRVVVVSDRRITLSSSADVLVSVRQA